MLRVNTSGGAHVIEFYEANGAAWTSLAAGGGSGATITAGTMAGRGTASGNGVYEEITVGLGLAIYGLVTTRDRSVSICAPHWKHPYN